MCDIGMDVSSDNLKPCSSGAAQQGVGGGNQIWWEKKERGGKEGEKKGKGEEK